MRPIDVAHYLGVSRQRVSQLASEPGFPDLVTGPMGRASGGLMRRDRLQREEALEDEERTEGRRERLVPGQPEGAGRLFEWYAVVALAMAVGFIVLFPAFRLVGDHTVFWLDAWEILWFLVYWILQTTENWDEEVN